MNHEYSEIIDKLLDMHPDPIPNFVLLKEFKRCAPDSIGYQNAYERVCEHPFVKKIEISQNSKGFWPSFHSFSEGLIRKLLWYGLNSSHICLERVIGYTVKLLHNEEPHDRFEKQDNIRWWPEIFMPLACAATLSLLDNTNETLDFHRKRWAAFAEVSLKKGYYNYETDDGAQNGHFNFFSKPVSEKRSYDYEADKEAQNEFFGFTTKRIIPPRFWRELWIMLLEPNIIFCMKMRNQSLKTRLQFP